MAVESIKSAFLKAIVKAARKRTGDLTEVLT
jgi:hypothetical protein